MSKITRRFFVATALLGGLAFAVPLRWFSRTRREVSGWHRSFNRWRHDMHPRWGEIRSTTIHRIYASPRPGARRLGWVKEHVLIRELRWPDNNDLVERTVEELGAEKHVGPEKVEWHDGERANRLSFTIERGGPFGGSFRAEVEARARAWEEISPLLSRYNVDGDADGSIRREYERLAVKYPFLKLVVADDVRGGTVEVEDHVRKSLYECAITARGWAEADGVRPFTEDERAQLAPALELMGRLLTRKS